MAGFISNFKKQLDGKFSFLKEKKLLIACSGGLDSVVLAHLMWTLHYDIALAHCNFSLRAKESDADEMFVIGLAKQWEVPVFAETFDTKKYAREHGISTQMAARDLRYNWFDQILKNFSYAFLLTAHHFDDDMETFFINLSRGTGLRGLCGIPEINENVVRPLLGFSKEEILSYATNHGLQWREDSSNQRPDYLRNKLRLEVLPEYKKAVPSLLGNFQKAKAHLKASQSLIDDYMALVFKLAVTQENDHYSINIKKINELPHTQEILYELLSGFGFSEWNDVVGLLQAQSGKQVFSKTHRLLKNRNQLILTQRIEPGLPQVYEVPLDGIDRPLTLRIGYVKNFGKTDRHAIYVAKEKLEFPLLLRKWQPGDSFHPFGMKGRKKVSKFLKDEKVPLTEKENTWVLLSGDRIVWVIDHRMDDHFKLTDDKQKILRIAHLDRAIK